MARIIELLDIVKVFGRHAALNHIDLYIRQNEFVTLLGPSGCGKTTTLRIIGDLKSLLPVRFFLMAFQCLRPRRIKENLIPCSKNTRFSQT